MLSPGHSELTYPVQQTIGLMILPQLYPVDII